MSVEAPKPWILGLSVATTVLLGLGCGDDGGRGDYTYMDDDLPSGRCDVEDTDGCSGTTGSDTSSTTTPADGSPGSACGRSGECDDELVCSAPFTEGERGAFACVEACIGHMDEARWCADAAACCDPNATCTTRGYCIETGTDTDTGTDTGTQ